MHVVRAQMQYKLMPFNVLPQILSVTKAQFWMCPVMQYHDPRDQKRHRMILYKRESKVEKPLLRLPSMTPMIKPTTTALIAS